MKKHERSAGLQFAQLKAMIDFTGVCFLSTCTSEGRAVNRISKLAQAATIVAASSTSHTNALGARAGHGKECGFV